MRSINVGSPVSLVSVSETLGDIVTISHTSLISEAPDNPGHSYNPWGLSLSSSSLDIKEDTASDTESPSPGVPDDWEVLNEVDTSKELALSRDTRSQSWSFKGLSKLGRHHGLRQTAESYDGPKKIHNYAQSQSVKGSSMSLHTVNADLVGTITTSEQITAVCFSTAPEGLSVNVIATGLFNGVIR